MTKKGTFLLATAGLDAGSISEAASRLMRQSDSLWPFNERVILTRENLDYYCPQLLKRYPEIFSIKHKGFGYYSWKAEFILSLMKKQRLIDGGVVWMDAGCEVNSNVLTKFTFARILESAVRNGGWFYSLRTPETHYSKRDLIIRFPESSRVSPDHQIQANFFVLHGERGEELARNWLSVILEDRRNFDFSQSYGGENSDFVEHRNDQSILSLMVKSMKFPISRFVPPAQPRGVAGTIKGLISPVWIARNRTGLSIQNSWVKRYE